MKKVIRLTEKDLTRLVEMVISEERKSLNEQKFIIQAFGKSADDIVKNYGDDAMRALDDIFSKVFSKPGNFVKKGEEVFIKNQFKKISSQ